MSRGRKLLVAISLAFSAALLVHTYVAPDGWQRRLTARHDLAGLEEDIAKAETRAARLRADIEALRQRSDVQERVVRDELGYVRPGDVVLELRER